MSNGPGPNAARVPRTAGVGAWLLGLAALGLVIASAAVVAASASVAAPHAAGRAGATLTTSRGPIHDRVGEPIPFGGARYFGAPPQLVRREQIVAMASTPNGRGYWLVSIHGTVYARGDAHNYGSAVTHSDVVAIVATPGGAGYWLAFSNGSVRPFGDARAHGSASGHHPRVYIVAMAATPDGEGYWLVAANGRVYPFGDARGHGSAKGTSPVVAMAATPDGGGYWIAFANGSVRPFGDAHRYASAYGSPGVDIVAMAATPRGNGYWLFDADGAVYPFGSAHHYGQAFHGKSLNSPIVDAAALPNGAGYWLLPTVGLPPPGPGFVVGKVTAIGDSVMLDAAPCLEADIPGVDVEAKVSRQWDDGEALAAQLKSEDRLGAVVIIDLGTNGPVTPGMFTSMMKVLSGASRVVFVTVHLPPSYSWWQSVNETLENGVPKYSRDRLADFEALALKNPQWFGPDGVHMPIGGAGAEAMAALITSEI